MPCAIKPTPMPCTNSTTTAITIIIITEAFECFFTNKHEANIDRKSTDMNVFTEASQADHRRLL